MATTLIWLKKCVRSVIPWLSTLDANEKRIASICAILTVGAAFYTIFIASSDQGVKNTFQVEGNNNVGQIAGRDITNIGDPKDKEYIASLLETVSTQQNTIDNLISGSPAPENFGNPQAVDGVADAVIGVSELRIDATLIQQAKSALAQGDTKQAKELYKADAEAKVKAGEDQLQEAAQSYRRLGALISLDDTAASLQAYEKAVKYWPGDIRSWNQLGHLYLLTGKPVQASEAYEQVGKLAYSSDEPKLWAAISNGHLGNVHFARAEWDWAGQMFQDALEKYTELDNKEGMATQYGNLGNVLERLNEPDEALRLLQKAFDLFEELGDELGMAYQYGNLGIVYQRIGELDQAFEKYKLALDLHMDLSREEGMANHTGNSVGIANQYGNLGNLQRARAHVELDQSAKMYVKALALNRKLGRKEGMARQYINLGKLYKIRGKLRVARMFGRMAADRFDAIESLEATEARSWTRQLEAEIFQMNDENNSSAVKPNESATSKCWENVDSDSGNVDLICFDDTEVTNRYFYTNAKRDSPPTMCTGSGTVERTSTTWLSATSEGKCDNGSGFSNEIICNELDYTLMSCSIPNDKRRYNYRLLLHVKGV